MSTYLFAIIILMKEITRRKSYHHKNLKEALLQTTMQLIETEGYEKITLRELAKLLGVSRSAIYRHFDSKEHLFETIILQGFEELKEQIQSVYDQELPITEKIAKTVEVYVAFAMASPARYRLMFGDKLMQLREKSCDMDQDRLDSSFGLLVSMMQEAQEEGVFAKGDPTEQAVAVWALIHGEASLLIDGHPMVVQQRQKLLATGLNMILKGLG